MTDQNVPFDSAQGAGGAANGAGGAAQGPTDFTKEEAGPKRLRRSRTDKWMGGVAGGIAEYFGVDSTWVRVAFVASIILPGPQVLLYLLLWLIIPQD